MSKEPIEYLKHIRDECLFILSVSGNDFSKDKLIQDEILKRAVVRSLEIIGEATKKIPADFKIKWNTINWKNMAGMRDRLIHDYMGINYSIVWDVIRNLGLKMPAGLTSGILLPSYLKPPESSSRDKTSP